MPLKKVVRLETTGDTTDRKWVWFIRGSQPAGERQHATEIIMDAIREYGRAPMQYDEFRAKLESGDQDVLNAIRRGKRSKRVR